MQEIDTSGYLELYISTTIASGESINDYLTVEIIDTQDLHYFAKNVSTNSLYGKKILAIGDSFVKGHSLSDNQTWLYKLAKRHNMTYYNYGFNGASIAYDPNDTQYTSIMTQLQSILDTVNETDYIVVLGGHNDSNPSLHGGSAIPIGNDTDNVNTTFKGALNILITSLLTKYPNAKLLMMSPFYRRNTEEPYGVAMEEVSGLWGQSFYDCYHRSGITFKNQAHKNLYELGGSLHMNELGQERFSYLVEKQLELLG